jgi:branched-chain amino acid transport system substrate-binding protein
MTKQNKTTINRRTLLASAAAAAVLPAMPWISRASAQDSGPIKIGFPVPLTGLFATEAQDQVRAAQLAAKEFNDAGGLNGRMCELLVRDDRLNPGEAATRTLELIEKDKAHFICGTLSAAVQLSVNNVTKARGVIYVSISQSDKISEASDAGPLTFHEAVNPHLMSGAVARYAVGKFGKKAVCLVSDYAYGHENLRGFQRAGAPLGLEIIADLRHPLGQTDYSTFLPRIASLKPDILFVANFGGDLVNSIKQATDFGLKSSMKIVCPTLLYTSRIAGGDDAFEGVAGAAPFYWGIEDKVPSAKTFNDKFKAAYEGRYPSDYGAMGYSGIRQILDAVKIAKTTETQAVATALRGLKYDYYKGAQSYRACDQQSIQSVFVLESKTKNKRNQYDVFDVVVTEPADEKRLRTCDELGHKS